MPVCFLFVPHNQINQPTIFVSMKYSFIVSFLLFLCACQEQPVEIVRTTNSGSGNPTTTKKVLIEEFTGASCANCPTGTAEIQSLQAVHGEKLVSVAIHAGFFATKTSESKYDFLTADGTAIEKYLGEAEGYPSAVINRKETDGLLQISGSVSKWAGVVADQLQEKVRIGVAIKNNYDSNTRQLSTTITLSPTETIVEPMALSVYITENNIIDAQKNKQEIVKDYTHRHVFRKALTAAIGTPITEALTSGTTLTKTFTYTLPSDWVVENCSLVAFISGTGTDKKILQVEETKIK
jgi:Outer membrane protein Omp28